LVARVPVPEGSCRRLPRNRGPPRRGTWRVRRGKPRENRRFRGPGGYPHPPLRTDAHRRQGPTGRDV